MEKLDPISPLPTEDLIAGVENLSRAAHLLHDPALFERLRHYEVGGPGPALLMMAPGGFDSTIEKWTSSGIWSGVKPWKPSPIATHA